MTVDIEKKLAELEEAKQSALVAQTQIDNIALADCIEQYDGDVVKVPVKIYRKGLPSFAVVRAPSRPEIKRFQDRIAKDKTAATSSLVQLGVCCLVYPDKDTFEKMLERIPAFDVTCGNAALDLSIGKAKDEGKD